MNMEVEEANCKFSLKLWVDTSSNKVLYAEANKDFVDFLFNILSLPIATIINLLKGDEEMVGCIGNIYKSIEALCSDYMQPNITKDSVLKPTTVCPSNFFLLNHHSPPNSNNTTKKFYACSNSTSMASASASASAYASNSSPSFSFQPTSPFLSSPPLGGFRLGGLSISSSKSCNYVSDVPSTICLSCHRVMSRELNFIGPKTSNSVDMASPSSIGYVKGLATYMVMDNLKVTPLSGSSVLTLMNESQVRDVASVVGKHVQVGPKEGVKILKASLETRAMLTTVFLERAHSFHGID